MIRGKGNQAKVAFGKAGILKERQHSKTKLAVEVGLLSAVNQSLQGWCLSCITSLEGYLGLLLLSPFSPLENL